MPPKSKKRVSQIDDYDHDGGFVEDAPKSKRAKTTKSAAVSKELQHDDDGNPFWELSGKRRVQVSEFKGIQMVNIREYYEKDGKALPGKKGISLSLDQFSALVELLPQLESTLISKGQETPRPDYSSSSVIKPSASVGDTSMVQDEGEEEEPHGDAQASSKHDKKNHEATSDEDE